MCNAARGTNTANTCRDPRTFLATLLAARIVRDGVARFGDTYRVGADLGSSVVARSTDRGATFPIVVSVSLLALFRRRENH
ncbi:MAG: hypothetical protein LC659_15750 [Myxococcales bacterium]|nr:hypothetical protein [Myxococcales bacterium]